MYFLLAAFVTIVGCKFNLNKSETNAQGIAVDESTPGALNTVILKGKALCTGTLVRLADKIFVVSAAHCAKPASSGAHQEGDPDYTVRFPLTAQDFAKKPIEALFVKKHEGYSAKPDANGVSTFFYKWDDDGDGNVDVTEGNVNDVALWYLKVSSEDDLPKKYKAAEFATDAIPTKGQRLTALGAGLGQILPAESNLSGKLIDPFATAFAQVELTVETVAPISDGAPDDGAKKMIRSQAGKIREAQSFLCRGDSGGPAFIVEGGKAKLYGIASFVKDKKNASGTGKEYDCEAGVQFHNFAPMFKSWFEEAAQACATCDFKPVESSKPESSAEPVKSKAL